MSIPTLADAALVQLLLIRREALLLLLASCAAPGPYAYATPAPGEAAFLASSNGKQARLPRQE